VLRTIAGLEAVSRGTIRFDDRDITSMATAARAELGIALVPSARATFATMTVWDNLLVGCRRFAWDGARVSARLAEVFALFPRLAERPLQRAGSLSGGEQQMLGLGMALVRQPTLLLVDELSHGLAPAAVADLTAVIAGLKDRGTTVIVVEQSADVTARLADRTVRIERGSITPS
jgi:branched-chain amino acid transport system ATP-binding protein